MTRTLLLRPSLCLVVLVALLLPGAYASAGQKGSGGVPLTATFDPTQRLGGDAISNTYADGQNCSDIGICLRVQLISNSKTLALDTRGTDGPRQLTINFTDFCGKTDANNNLVVDCGLLSGLNPDPNSNSGFPFSSAIVRTEALLEVLLSRPFPNSGSVTGLVKLWFTQNGVDYRIDWQDVTVASQDLGQWTVSTDSSSEVAGLSELSGKRTRPGDIGNKGFYKIPFVLDACEGVLASCPPPAP